MSQLYSITYLDEFQAHTYTVIDRDWLLARHPTMKVETVELSTKSLVAGDFLTLTIRITDLEIDQAVWYKMKYGGKITAMEPKRQTRVGRLVKRARSWIYPTLTTC